MPKHIIVFYLLCCSIIASAQNNSCPTFVQDALDFVDLSCAETGRNEACYGNGLINLQTVDDIKLDEIGDIIPISAFSSMRLSEMNLDEETWGISLMRIQANLPDTIPGQNVEFILFGDVEIEDKSTIAAQLTTTAIGGVNVRSRPTTTEDNVITSLSVGEDVTAIGRLGDNSWIQIRIIINDKTVTGWVSADFLRSDGDLSSLSLAEPNQAAYGRMQAFTLKTGIGDSACNTAPDSGMLIQTPEGALQVNLLVNEVAINLGSTVLLRSQPNDFLYVSVLEGQAVVTALNTPVTVPAGVTVRVPMTEDSIPERVQEPTPATESEAIEEETVDYEVIDYNEDNFETLPIESLAIDIEVAPESEAPIITGFSNFAGGVLVGDNVRRPFFISFVNPDGNVIDKLLMDCVSTNHPRGCSAWNFNPTGSGVQIIDSFLVSGDWSGGRLSIVMRCTTASPAGLNTTISMELVDIEGLESESGTFNFDCVAPEP